MLGVLFFWLWLVAGLPMTQEPAPLNLPPEAQALLNDKYPGWTFAPVEDEIVRYVERQGARGTRPDLIAGDFDGDGRTDYAALVAHGIVEGGDGVPVGPRVRLLAFMQREKGFKLFVVDDWGGGDYICLARKGEQGYDYETQENFVYEHDAICAVIWEKAATSYVYEHGKWRAVITSD